MQNHISEDETLVLLTLAGDPGAYEALVIRHRKTVIAAANSVLHSRYLAEDAAQDAFITAWMKLNVLREGSRFGPWVCRIAKNCAKNMIVRYRSYLPLEDMEEVLSDGIDDDPQTYAVRNAEAASLRDTVTRLPARVGEIIRMHYFEELSVGEIAARLGISEGTVKWQLHDGRKRMRGELCAMNETVNDTLTRRVMKKVEELKRWQYQNSKNGFEAVYNDVLADVEAMPESAHAVEAFEMAQKLTGVDSLFHAWAGTAKEQEQRYDTYYRTKPEKTYRTRAGAEEIRYDNGMPRRYTGNWFGKGLLCSADLDADFLFRNAAYCDGQYRIPDAKIGQPLTGSDGTVLMRLDDSKAVRTPAGTFANCQVWKTVHREGTYVTYYAENIGIVRQEKRYDGLCEVRLLSHYSVHGTGYLPLVTGNVWEYTTEYPADSIAHTNRITVSYADDEHAVLAQTWTLERLSYDENSWLDMISAVRNEYWNGECVCDVTRYMERAKALAHTPVEIAHTAAACDTAQRIMDTNKKFNPQATVSGHWNFFARNTATRSEDGKQLLFEGSFRWSFELKNIDSTAAQQLLYNDIYGILNDDCGCIWSEDWKAGTKHTVRTTHYGTQICTAIVCEDGGAVTTKAGTFSNCLRVCIDTQGLEDGLSYRGGKKNYIFAPDIGIVRVENEQFGGARTVIYELSAYEGMGAGYQPLGNRFLRKYEALDLTDGYLSCVEYTYVTVEDGTTVILENRTGIRRTPDRITEYASVDSELQEECLWDEGKHDESRAVHAVNNIRLMMHFLGRPSRYWAAPDKAAAWNQYRLELIEGLSQNGEIPRAWLGFYAATTFRLACALFGCGRNDEGYEWLDRAFVPMERWLSIPDGEKLEFGDPLIWGDITVERDGEWLNLPDGTREPIPDNLSYLFGNQRHLFHYGLTVSSGWEWFDGVRGEERFNSCIPRALALTEIN